MRILSLALKDLSEIARDWKSALFLLAMPVIFTIFMGVMFSGGEESDPRLPLGFADQDGSDMSVELLQLLEASDIVRPVLLEESAIPNAGRQVGDGDLAGVLLVPAGFGQAALAGTQPSVTLIVDRGTMAGQTTINAVQTALTRLLAMVESARLSAEVYTTAGSFASDAALQAYLKDGLARADEAWQDPPLAVVVEPLHEPGSEPDAETAAEETNPFTQTSPGMIVQFTIFGVMTPAGVLVTERKSRTLQRLLTTPARRSEIIAGHILAMFLVALVQITLLVIFGQVALGVNYLRRPLATLLMVTAMTLFTASLGLLIGTAARTNEQVIMFSLVAMFVLTGLGGAWFPLAGTGRTFAAIGRLLPTAWAMDGFQNIILRGLGLDSVLLPVAIILGYTIMLFGLALWRFRFE